MSVFHHKTGFSQTSHLLFKFQCNEHVEMNKFLCHLACTWMTVIDSQSYNTGTSNFDHYTREWSFGILKKKTKQNKKTKTKKAKQEKSYFILLTANL